MRKTKTNAMKYKWVRVVGFTKCLALFLSLPLLLFPPGIATNSEAKIEIDSNISRVGPRREALVTSHFPDTEQTSIFVDKNSGSILEDGSAQAPFHTITKGLEKAREIRFGSSLNGVDGSSKVINLHVAASPTPYVGSFDSAVFDPDSLIYDPTKEKLPLLVNIPNLKLQGETQLVKDENGLPNSVVPGTETIITSDRPQGSKQYMVMATRTHPLGDSQTEMAGDNVTIAGFSIQADARRQFPSVLIAFDGVADFVARGNVLTNGCMGVWTRLASGRIENNLVINNEVGFHLSAGSKTFPATIKVVANRVIGSQSSVVSLAVLGSGDTSSRRVDLDFGVNQFQRIRLASIFDRVLNPDDVPDTIKAQAIGNEFNGNNQQQFGIRVVGYLQDPYVAVAGQDEVANVTVVLRNNISSNHRTYGLIVDAGQIPLGDRRIVTIRLSLHDTTLQGNSLAPAIFSLWRFGGSIGGSFSAPNPTFAHDSRIEVCGDVTRFHYDNRQDPDPATNPAPTNNVLTINGVALDGLCVGTCFTEVSETCKSSTIQPAL